MQATSSISGIGFDTTEFQLSVRPHLGRLFGMARGLSKCEDEASDVLQETLLRAWKNWHRFEPGTNLRAWLMRVLYRVFLTRERSRRRRTRAHHGFGECQRPSSDVLHRDPWLQKKIKYVLSSLSESHRNVIDAVDIRELSYAEASKELGCPVGTVMSRLSRARGEFRKKAQADFGVLDSF